MKKHIILMVFLISNIFYSQVGIGTAQPASSAILDLTSNDKALLVTRVPSAASIVTPINGMIIYDLSVNCFRGYQANAWTNCSFTACTGPGPTITTQPIGGSACSPATYNLSVTASGGGPYLYQWRKDGADIVGATGSTYSATASGSYTVIVSNPCASTPSNAAVVTVNAGLAITSQPSDVTVNVENQTATFSAAATGSGTLTYAWEISRDGGSTFTPITVSGYGLGGNDQTDHDMVVTNGTTPTLNLKWVSPAEEGRKFRLKVTSSGGCAANTVYSNVVTLHTTNSPAYIFDNNLCGSLSGWSATGPVGPHTSNPCGMYLNPGNTSSGGVIFRDVTTTIGQSYTLSVRMLGSGFNSSQLIQAYNGATLINSVSNSGDNFVQLTFTATSSTTRLRIADNGITNASDGVVYLTRLFAN
jgi:hypothetical protein